MKARILRTYAGIGVVEGIPAFPWDRLPWVRLPWFLSSWVLTGFLTLLSFNQAMADDQGWQIISSLEGAWVGTGDGVSGLSEVTQEFELVLGGHFMRVQTRSVFPPQERNPEGEIHEDLGFFSLDKARKTVILRAFYIEGFVNQYVLGEVSADGKALVFVTEAVESAPAGTQARLELQLTGADTLEESFHVAFPGHEFSCFSTNHLTRKASRHPRR